MDEKKMARYIDTTLLKAEFTGNFIDTYSPALIKAIIDGQPTADVQKVRHGKWIKASCSEKDGDAHCSECNHWDWSDYKYCSECGAKMDE